MYTLCKAVILQTVTFISYIYNTRIPPPPPPAWRLPSAFDDVSGCGCFVILYVSRYVTKPPHEITTGTAIRRNNL